MITDYFVIAFSAQSEQSDVLIIRLDAIGDFIIWLDSAKEYRRIYPDKKILLFANEVWASLAKYFNYWDEVIPVNVLKMVRNPLYRWKVLSKVRNAGYNVVIQPQWSRVFLLSDSIVRATVAPVRIGFVGDIENKEVYQRKISDRWYKRLLPSSHDLKTEIERNADFIREMTGKLYEPKISVISRLLELPENLNTKEPYFVIFPGASVSFRQWPAEKFVEVMRIVSQKHSLIPVLCGSNSEKSLCSKILDNFELNARNYTGKTELSQFVEVVRNAKFLISNETSAVHIAAAVGTQSICILGGGHYGRFVPYPEQYEGLKPLFVNFTLDCYNCNWKCIHKTKNNEPYPCIKSITVDQVINIVERIMNEKGK